MKNQQFTLRNHEKKLDLELWELLGKNKPKNLAKTYRKLMRIRRIRINKGSCKKYKGLLKNDGA